MSPALDLRRREEAETELLDHPGQSPRLLAENLADLRRVNRWLGGNWLTIHALGRLLPELRAGTECRLLDVGTGGADMPDAMIDWGRRRGLRVNVCAADASFEILHLASRRDRAGIELMVADGRRLPFADASFDVATCSLVLHHLGSADATSLLREMARVSRRGIVVNDLIRGWPGYVGAWLYGRLCTRNPLTRNDGPLSARRAYAADEVAALLAEAGLVPTYQGAFLAYRFVVAARRST